MPEYLLRRDAMALDRVERLKASLLASPLVGRSTLAGSFRHTRGFALTFTRAGVDAVVRRFPELTEYLRLVLGEQGALRSLTDRLLRRTPPPETNAFYVNLLLVGDGGSVGRHTDATLRGPSGHDGALPQRVTVLYLEVPRGEGGELRLYRGERRVGAIAPRTGALLHFRGELQHEVTPLRAAPESLRASLVCEQYALPPEALARLPELNVQSKAGFEAYLASHQRAPDR